MPRVEATYTEYLDDVETTVVVRGTYETEGGRPIDGPFEVTDVYVEDVISMIPYPGSANNADPWDIIDQEAAEEALWQAAHEDAQARCDEYIDIKVDEAREDSQWR